MWPTKWVSKRLADCSRNSTWTNISGPIDVSIDTIVITPEKLEGFWDLLFDVPNSLMMRSQRLMSCVTALEEKERAPRPGGLRLLKHGPRGKHAKVTKNVKNEMQAMARGGAKSMIEMERQRIEARRAAAANRRAVHR